MRCLVTGVAGFIGSHLAQRLLVMGHVVVGVDNFITGEKATLDSVVVPEDKHSPAKFSFKLVDLSEYGEAERLFKEEAQFDVLFHNAALGSVPRSLEWPELYVLNNSIATRNVFMLACEYKVPRVIYASSSSVYGDIDLHMKSEDILGSPLSPYAISKRSNELDAEMMSYCFDETTFTGLRYFNVFGPRQRTGQYAAVIAEWLDCIRTGRTIYINGHTEIVRDFTFVDNVTYFNMLCASSIYDGAIKKKHEVFNVAAGEAVSLWGVLKEIEAHAVRLGFKMPEIVRREMRAGDVKASYADISKAKERLNYEPSHNWRKGLEITCKFALSGME